MKTTNQVNDAIRQTDAIAAIAGFEKTDQRKALDAALLSGRATATQITDLLILEARLIGANNVMAAMSITDERHATIKANYTTNLATLYALAESMGGAVRLTLKV
jgi:hypothetical protein